MTSQTLAHGSTAALAPAESERMRHCLSDMADGQADDAISAVACAAWRDQPEMRQTWHTYHLIGDVLRSEELASPAGHDAVFLARLRDKLAAEPVVMAPMPEQASRVAQVRARKPFWLMPAAAAAGFVLVAGVLVVTRLSGPDAGESAVPLAAVAPGALNASDTPNAFVGPATPAGLAMIRDARLDAYVDAHRATRGVGGLAVPGMGLRNADVALPTGIER